MRVELVGLGAVLLILGLGSGALGLSVVSNPPPVGTQVALVLYGNMCPQPGAPTGCAPQCTIYSCTAVPSASPSLLQGMTDADGKVQLILSSYADGSGSGFYSCTGTGLQFVSIQNSPFYQAEAQLSGQWQFQSPQWQPGPSVYGCDPTVYQSSSPYQFQMSINDYVTNTDYTVDVTVCVVSCAASPTYTVTTTNVVTNSSTYTTTVTGTQGSTTFTTTATVTELAASTVAQVTTSGATTSTFTQSITSGSQTQTVTQTPTVVGASSSRATFSYVSLGLIFGGVVLIGAGVKTRGREGEA